MAQHRHRLCADIVFVDTSGSRTALAAAATRPGAGSRRAALEADAGVRREPAGADRVTPVMAMLAGRVPLCLLLDLWLPGQPASAEILRVEGGGTEPWWER